jgi:DNA helicase-2/ATP-dependent DNA helicase PcrA
MATNLDLFGQNEPLVRTTKNDKILDNLNPGQRQAVEHGLGPQLVVAGAGTGKTAVITRRIAWLVASKACSAREILGLTFTEKAAEEMETRVDVLVPYGFTDSTICTFHAFGDKVLREQGMLLGLNPNYKVLSTPEQLIFLREHLFDLPLDKLRPLSDPTRHLQMILGMISRAKDEDVTPAQYREWCERFRAGLKADPEDPAFSLWQKQNEVAEIYACYQELMQQKGLMDFGDLITSTLALLRRHPDVLEEFRQRFRYILVDEFQDTNAAQFELIRLLAGKNGNITVVGDDDQSIYKFRGAAVSNILQFPQHYPSTQITVLTENYRSTQPILDAAYRLIRHNDPDRLEVLQHLNKRLTAQTGEAVPVPVLYQRFDTVSAECDWIAAEMEKRKDRLNLDWSDFAALTRANRHADPLMRSLNMRGIPFRFSGHQGLYRQPEVRLCTAFLRCVADPSAPLPFHELASSELYDLPAEDLASLSAASRRSHQPLRNLLQHRVTSGDEHLSEAGQLAAQKLLEDLTRFVELSRRLATGQLLYRFLTETGLLARYSSANSVESDCALKNLAKFFNVVRNYESISKSDRVIHFVEHLDMLEEVGDDPNVSESDEDFPAVHILTVHRSKGLEFPVVFIPGLAANRFPSVNRNATLGFPLELAKETIPAGDPHLAEERRLFYVAMTRARQELILTSARDYGGTRAYKPSRFIMEALELPELETKVFSVSALEQIRSHAPVPGMPLPAPAPMGASELLTLSYYQIDDFLTCPLKYKYVHILRIPVLPHHTILYGNALHTAMNEFYRRKMTGLPVTEEDLTRVFLDAWVNEGFISREHEEMRQKAGLDAIRLFLKNELDNPLIPKYIEKAFQFQLGPNKVTGRIDRVDYAADNTVTIVDFKSSEVRSQKDADQKAKESLQLKIYAAAWLRTENRLPDRLQLYFLESGLCGTIIPDAKKIQETEETIMEVGDGIRQQVFPAKGSAWICGFCAYRSICPEAES